MAGDDTVAWSHILDLAGPAPSKEDLIKLFFQFEGKPTDGRDGQNRILYVSRRSFADHFKVNRNALYKWLSSHLNTRQVTCAVPDCSVSFSRTGSSNRRYCDGCRGTSKTKRIAEKNGRTKHRDSSGLSKFILSCGHSVYFRSGLTDGERLWCARCSTWIEYIINKFAPMCNQGLHRLVGANVFIVGKKRLCQECLLAEDALKHQKQMEREAMINRLAAARAEGKI